MIREKEHLEDSNRQLDKENRIMAKENKLLENAKTKLKAEVKEL